MNMFPIKRIGQGIMIGLEDVIKERPYNMTVKCFTPTGKLL